MNQDLLKFYEQDVLRTAKPVIREVDEILNGALGSAGEAGEIAEVVKKVAFQGHELDREEVIEEIGDTLYYLTYLTLKLDGSLKEVIQKNIEKRKGRYPDGFEPERSINR